MTSRRGILRVRISEEVVAFPVEHVVEVLTVDAITRLYRLPGHIAGVLNLRGQICPLADLGRLLGYPATPNKRAVLVTHEEGLAAFTVDRILTVEDLPDEPLAEIPRSVGEKRRGFFSGLLRGAPPTLLLKIEKLFEPEIWGSGKTA